MSRSNPVLAAGAVGGAILAAGYMVASYGASHPIGNKIPEQKDRLRMEGAESEEVKSGYKPEEAIGHTEMPKKGGDKGIKVEGATKNM
ncbi:MAG: hypothetical protein M1828_005823 [Chrysothrix sp. TS-e1954]|nr:MAG: hypothetical protein M1828_005823 [Chrysothrix sp. TS-e1954]